MSMRWGMTVPLAGVSLADHAAVYAALADAGFTDLWSSEVNGSDAFTPLALAAAWAPGLRLGTAVAPVFTRGPGLLAMTAAALAEAAPGRFQLGIGASSPVVVGDWNAAEFTEPYARSRDMLRFLRAALAGEAGGPRVTGRSRSAASGWNGHPPTPPQILLAALRPGMLRLAAAEADGVILNWLAPADVATALAETKAAGPRLRGGRAHLRLPDRGCGARPRRGPAADRRLPDRSGLRRVPPLARAARPSSVRCGRPGRPATGRRRCPRSPTRWSTS